MAAVSETRAKTDPHSISLTSLDNVKRVDVDRFINVTRSAPIQALYAPYRDVWCPYTEDTLRKTLLFDNPIFEHTDCRLFIATQDGVDVGRVAAFYNPLSTLTTEKQLGSFGFFEATSLDVARALLLDGAWPYLQTHGAKGMVGNNNPTNNDEVGILIEGFHRHTLLLEFNPPDYKTYLEALGFTKAMDVLSFIAKLTPEFFQKFMSGKTDPASFERASKLMARRAGITLEYLNKRKVAQTAHEFCGMYNRSWRDHWGFEPFTSAELLYLSADLLQLLPSDLVITARNKEGKPVGAALCTPDLNQLFRGFDGKMGIVEMIQAVYAMWAPRWLPSKHRPTMLRIIALGVLAEYNRRGASAALMMSIVYHAFKKGYKEASVSWVLEDNQAVLDIPQRFELPVDQRWRMYEYRPSA